MAKGFRLWILSVSLGLSFSFLGYQWLTRYNFNTDHQVGDVIDSLNGVEIYYNGGVNTNEGRNLSLDGYNLGIKYQCVEFVKRYFYQRYQHQMPDSFGHARDFFDNLLTDGSWNEKRALRQFTNGSQSKPMADDLLVFAPWILNPYGHVAIIAAVTDNGIEIAQQNPGPFAPSREYFPLIQQAGLWYIDAPRAKGWLRWETRPDVVTENSGFIDPVMVIKE
ncbi:CHAP domain-containing protein [Shewanella cutis]|uniref:CHAP domain-containing protein n=1 Tax=Shewanella cutis TaxID=2766780 RepID=A0ABS9QWJ3_9GAMM|nr:CHAP domain-containing protein [Shewanella sp. PS-2]MCG9964732.1 CHAP domain-containing protein [Shewanella sp. PS-2]